MAFVNICHHAPCNSSLFPLFVNFSFESSLLDSGWDHLLLRGVGISYSISLAELTTSTIVTLGIPIMASFNFFCIFSLKVSFKYASS